MSNAYKLFLCLVFVAGPSSAVFNATEFFTKLVEAVPEVQTFKKTLDSKTIAIIETTNKNMPKSEADAMNAIKMQSVSLAQNISIVKSNLYNKVMNMQGKFATQFAYDTLNLIHQYQPTILTQTSSTMNESSFTSLLQIVKAKYNKLPEKATTTLAKTFPNMATFIQSVYFQGILKDYGNSTSTNLTMLMSPSSSVVNYNFTNIWALIPIHLVTYNHLQVYLPPMVITFANSISSDAFTILLGLLNRRPANDAISAQIISAANPELWGQIDMINSTIWQMFAAMTNVEAQQFFYNVMNLSSAYANSVMHTGNISYAELQYLVIDVQSDYYNLSTTARQYISKMFPSLGNESTNTFKPHYNYSQVEDYKQVVVVPAIVAQFIPYYVLDFINSLTAADIGVFMALKADNITSKETALAVILTQSPDLVNRIELLNATIYGTFENMTNMEAQNFIETTLITACETFSKNLANMTDAKDPEAIILMIKATLDNDINAYYNLSTGAHQSLQTAYPELTKFFQSPFWDLILIVIDSAGTNDSVFDLSISGIPTNIEEYLPPYVLNFSTSLTQTDIQVLMQAGMQYHASQADTLAYIKTQSPSLAAKIVALNNTIYANVSNPDGRQWIYTTINVLLSFSQSMITSMSASSMNHESPNITAIVMETVNFTMGVVNNFTKLSAEAKQSLADAFPNVTKLVQSTIFKIAICVLKIFNEYPEAFDLITPYFNMGSMNMGSGSGGLSPSIGSYMSIGNIGMTDLLPANKGKGSFLDTVISMVSKK